MLMIIVGISVPNSFHIVNGREGLIVLITFLATTNQTPPRRIVITAMIIVLSSGELFLLER